MTRAKEELVILTSGEPSVFLSELPEEALLRETVRGPGETGMKQLAEQGSQFIISTHSPIVMSYPGAEIYEITDHGLEPTELEETSHFRLMKRFILDRRGILRQMELEKE